MSILIILCLKYKIHDQAVDFGLEALKCIKEFGFVLKTGFNYSVRFVS